MNIKVRLTGDAEVHKTSQGRQVVHYSVATSQKPQWLPHKPKTARQCRKQRTTCHFNNEYSNHFLTANF